jgi:hypothetical protein
MVFPVSDWERDNVKACFELLSLPSPKDGRGAGGEGKDLSSHWDAPNSNERCNDINAHS